MIQLEHPDRVRSVVNAWASGRYTQCRGYLIQLINGAGYGRCAEGVAGDIAWRAGVLGLASVLDSRTVHYSDPSTSDFYKRTHPTQLISDWLGAGFHLWDRLDLTGLPVHLRERTATAVDARGWDVAGAIKLWMLNDAGLTLPEIADIIRCHLDLDLHLVVGTPEYDAVTRLHEREIAAWAKAGELDRTGVPALLAVLDRLDEWPELVTEDDARRLGPTVYGSYVQAVEAAVADAEEWAAVREAAVVADESLVAA